MQIAVLHVSGFHWVVGTKQPPRFPDFHYVPVVGKMTANLAPGPGIAFVDLKRNICPMTRSHSKSVASFELSESACQVNVVVAMHLSDALGSGAWFPALDFWRPPARPPHEVSNACLGSAKKISWQVLAKEVVGLSGVTVVVWCSTLLRHSTKRWVG